MNFEDVFFDSDSWTIQTLNLALATNGSAERYVKASNGTPLTPLDCKALNSIKNILKEL
jgi:hypothetical protein